MAETEEQAFEEEVAGWLLAHLPEEQAREFFDRFGGRKMPREHPELERWLGHRLARRLILQFFDRFTGKKIPKRPKFMIHADRQTILVITLACVISEGGKLTERAMDRAVAAACVSRSTVQKIWERGRYAAALEAIRARTSPIRLKKSPS